MQQTEVPEAAPPCRSVTVVLAGEIDLAVRDDIVDRVLDVLQERPHCVLIDLSGVTFLDCSGLSGLLMARERALGHGIDLHVSALSAPVEDLLELSGTLSLLTGRS